LKELREVFEREDRSLIMQAQDYLNNKVKLRVQRNEMEKKAQVKWDFNSGDHSKQVAELKK
jgi:hypothetical protein